MLWVILALGLLLRLGWGLSRPADQRAIDALPDQREYLSIAQNILSGHGANFFDPRFGQIVYAYRMPGYSWLIAACGCQVRIVRLVQVLLDTATVLAIFLLARRLQDPQQASDRAGIAAALLVAANPFLIFFSGLILSETLFTAMLAWGMVLLVSPARKSRAWFIGAALLALSIYVRPSALLLPIILTVGSARLAWQLVGWVYSPTIPGRKHAVGEYTHPTIHQTSPENIATPLPVGSERFAMRSWTRGVAAAILVALALAPWAWRNSQSDVVGHWVWTTTNDGITAYDGWNPAATGGSDQSFIRDMPELRTMGEVERSQYLAHRAREFVMHYPKRALSLSFIKLARLWSPIPLSEQYSLPAYRLAGLVYSVPFDLLVLAGLIRGKLARTAKVFLLIPAIYLTVVHMASVGSLRYLLPAIPPMSVVAGSLFLTPRTARTGAIRSPMG
jgi:4-amino-4-deoxy-L-arabinose transferase-like glycosyltransferase